jgi:hypothetical protein
VLGKYQNDSWLGGKGLRPDEEWPVAYHGTKEVNVMVRSVQWVVLWEF